jgi:epoxyqueuosine reductase QueG
MHIKDEIVFEIENLVRNCELNKNDEYGFKYFDMPIVGFASTNNPLFSKYKEIIGDFHYHPCEFFDPNIKNGTVIVWILPISKEIRSSNASKVKYPSLFWALQREYGEKFNMYIRKHMQQFLINKGFKAISPMLSEKWQRFEKTDTGIASNWSERHAAFAAGLGTFSLSDGLITKKGIAHRCGSIITDAILDTTERNFEFHLANCLFYNKKSKCGVCIKRCPAKAITENGHNKDLCAEYAYTTIKKAKGKEYQVNITGCGLCQTKVPCEHSLPFRDKNID